MLRIRVNGQDHRLDVDPELPLLWVVRDFLDLTGTKYGCGGGYCGACTVHIDGEPLRACQMKVSDVQGHEVVTIEGVTGPVAKAVRDAWQHLEAAKCGYCDSGQIMTAISLLRQNPKPSDADIVAAMDGSFCRCGTFTRIKNAIDTAAASLTSQAA